MGTLRTLILALAMPIVAYKLYCFVNYTNELQPLKLRWWGAGSPPETIDTRVNNVIIKIPETIIQDLNQRLRNTRFPVASHEDVHFQYGFNSHTLQKIINYWINDYKWYERETNINKYPHYFTNIQGINLHFVHVKPQNTTNAIIILLLHGWPGSFLEFYSLIDILTDKTKNIRFNFEFIVPSLPGYGWSSAAVKPGMGTAQMAVIMKELMERLGYKHWYVQGGDWGSQIASNMGSMYPKEVAGIHLNMCFSRTRKTQVYYTMMSFWPSLFFEERFEKKMYPISTVIKNYILESGYFHIQATKPDTVGAGLADSPAGLAAYILEKFSTGTNSKHRDIEDGGLTLKFSYDELLDNVMVYWLTNSMTSAMRIYAEQFVKENRDLELDNVLTKVPTWCARFPNEIFYQPDWILRMRYPNLKGSTDYKDGGHFAAMENPLLLASDIVLAIETFERGKPIFLKNS